MIALEMGVDSIKELTDVQQSYAEKIKEKLAAVRKVTGRVWIYWPSGA